MKYLLIIIVALPLFLNAQIGEPFEFGELECGYWKSLPADTSEWTTVDTLSKKKITTTNRDWAYDRIRQDVSNMVLSIYCPCGCDPSYSKYQYRVCKITGIRQQRFIYFQFKMIWPEETEYGKTVEKLKKQ